MINFNPRTGELFNDSELLEDGLVLCYITHTLKIVPDTERFFSLLSIKRLLNRYPSLMLLTDWTQSFMAQAASVELRIGIMKAAGQEYKPSEIQYLKLQKRRAARFCELTGHTNFDSNTMFMSYEDVPFTDINIGDSLSGHSHEGDQSLSYTPIREIFYIPIRIENDLNVSTRDYANEARNHIDYSQHEHIETLGLDSTLTVQDVLMAIMMDVNLDDEDDRLDDIEMLQGRLSGTDEEGEDEE